MSKHRSRLRAIAYATVTGMMLGCSSVLLLFADAQSNVRSIDGVSGEPSFSYALAFPGVFTLGLLFTLPSAAALVFAMARIVKAEPTWLHPLHWIYAGAIAAVPTAWLFGAMFQERLFEIPSVHTTLLLFGAMSGLAARFGYREVKPREGGT